MNTDCTVGIIMPAYNCASYIAHALESLEKQSVWPDMVVIVDDGSTDDTAAEISRFQASSDLPIKYVRQTNQGIASARNNGVEVCNTAYIAFLDSDDAFYPSFIEKARDALIANPALVLCFSNRHIVDENLHVMRETLDQPKFVPLGSRPLGNGVHTFVKNPFTTLLPGNIVPIGNLMLKRSTFEQVGGFDRELRVVEDRPFFLTMAKTGPFGFLTEPLGIWRAHESNTCGAGNALKIEWYANLGLKKIMAQAESLGLSDDEIQSLQQTRDAIPARMLYIAAHTVDRTYLGLAIGLLIRRRIGLKVLFRNTTRYVWRLLWRQEPA